jgi:hypothetical protein
MRSPVSPVPKFKFLVWGDDDGDEVTLHAQSPIQAALRFVENQVQDCVAHVGDLVVVFVKSEDGSVAKFECSVVIDVCARGLKIEP